MTKPPESEPELDKLNEFHDSDVRHLQWTSHDDGTRTVTLRLETPAGLGATVEFRGVLVMRFFGLGFADGSDYVDCFSSMKSPEVAAEIEKLASFGAAIPGRALTAVLSHGSYINICYRDLSISFGG